MNRQFLFFAVLAVVLASCQSDIKTSDSERMAAFDEWKQGRLKGMKAKEGWFTLAGLHLLKNGDNYLYSTEEDPIRVSAENENGSWVKISIDDERVLATPLTDAFKEQNDLTAVLNVALDEGKTTPLMHNNYKSYVIKRGEKYFLRVKNLDPSLLEDLAPIHVYEYNPEMVVSASVTPVSDMTVMITDAVGTKTPTEAEAKVRFKLKGKSYEFLAFPAGKRNLFINFKDATNGEMTYGAGRFLYPSYKDGDKHITLDFNLAENPPCAFTQYATCPLPVPQNVLEVAVNAGEKDYGHH